MSGTAVIDPVAKAMHDEMLRTAPSGSEHDRESCQICTTVHQPMEDSMAEITEQDVARRIDEAVRTATEPLTARIEELTSSQAAEAEQARIDEATAPLTARVTELENELEVRTNERDAAVKQHDDLVADLAQKDEDAKEQAAAEARRDERVAKVKEVASFKDDFYTDERMARWAAMEDAEFASLLEEFAATAGPRDQRNRETVPPRSPMTARDTASEGSRTSAIGTALANRHLHRRGA